MKLKESTFAIIAEKKDSISHKWFNQNIKNNKHKQHVFWDHSGEYYLYNKGNFIRCTENRPKDIPIYTESEFEAILKAEQDNEQLKEDYNCHKEMGNHLAMCDIVNRIQNDPKQITISYNLALEYIAERLNVDKGIIKIEMPCKG